MENKTIFAFIVVLSTLLLSISLKTAESNTPAPSTQAEALWNFIRNEKFKTCNVVPQTENNDALLLDTTKPNYDEARRLTQSEKGQSKNNDRIESLPGQPINVTFKQYGGYVTVDQNSGRALYYYFAEAHHSHKKTLPLLLWLSGGPGCSSLGFGAMEEIGPFHVYSDGKTLYANKYAWNKVANVLFLESPAGVGFSYSNNTDDTKTGGDQRTAVDNLAFLTKWLERFPEYKDREFFIAGDSYAGHFVPQLAKAILDQNKNVKSKNQYEMIINLKGIIMGNALIMDIVMADKAQWDYKASHALVSDDAASRVLKYCDFPLNPQSSENCTEALKDADTGTINMFNIYAPLCFKSKLTDKPDETLLSEFDPCSNMYVRAYLNRLDVQTALHSKVFNATLGWDFCSDIHFKWVEFQPTLLPLLETLITNEKLRVWLYSGDVDAVVPVTATKLAIKAMNLGVKKAWRAWNLTGEVGGYRQMYEGDMMFATVRGAGHAVPSDQPVRALACSYFEFSCRKRPT